MPIYATNIYNNDIDLIDPIFLSRTIPLHIKAWKFFKYTILNNYEMYNLSIRPWWNQAINCEHTPFVYMILNNDSANNRPSFLIGKRECLKFIFYMNLLWEEYQHLLCIGYYII